MHPLLDQFFHYDCIKPSAIRVHCVTEEERLSLRDLCKKYYPNLNDHYIVQDPAKSYGHTYFFWDTRLFRPDKDGNTVGFNSYIDANRNTYEFAEFMNIINIDMRDEISDLGDLL